MVTEDDRDSARRKRAEERRSRASLRRGRLEAIERDTSPLRGEAAVSLVQVLTLEGWSEAGFSIPTYDRANTPFRFVRRSLP